MMALRDKYPRGKGQYRLRKGQEGPMKTKISPGTAVARLGQYIYHFPTRMGGHVKVILRRTLVHWRGYYTLPLRHILRMGILTK
jgi:hypothetical protein